MSGPKNIGESYLLNGNLTTFTIKNKYFPACFINKFKYKIYFK